MADDDLSCPSALGYICIWSVHTQRPKRATFVLKTHADASTPTTQILKRASAHRRLGQLIADLLSSPRQDLLARCLRRRHRF
ncbi:hypothetical protein ACKZDW_17765 [Ralstonia syzygii subsp. celebesensis]|uniref:Uncharacterized protein n=1 Tax=blood disease bacterium A2-HR MARDI TaxID=1944648 RepID=A0A1U9VI57_9RALS|nr:hypothetical protein B0B51_10495 [blood disease bacterium A2-HR MARDI]